MFRQQSALIVPTFFALTLLLAACGGKPPDRAPQAAAATATSASPAASTPTAFEGLSRGLDNTTQARIRVVNTVMESPNVTVYINGRPAVNGGIAQQNIPEGHFSGWLYVEPGSYAVALAPQDATLEQALFPPVEVKAAAGRRYTVAAIGQLSDGDVQPLVLDEVALEAQAGAKAGDSILIELNNVKGAPGLDEIVNGQPVATAIPYGGATTWICPADTIHDQTIVSGRPDLVLFEADTWCEPGGRWVIPMYGADPTQVGNGNASQGTSDLAALDFLAGFNSRHVVANGHPLTFKTVLAAIATAGMAEQLADGGPYMFFAPTDEAFAELPKDRLDALLRDPRALANLLKAHVVDGYYPYGSISGSTYGQTDREVTNLLGQKLSLLELGGGLGINGLPVMGGNYTVGNGNRVHPIEKLLPVD